MQDFLNKIEKHKLQRKRLKLFYIKIKNCLSKWSIEKEKRQATNWEKRSATIYSTKD